ncbi:DUF927 domain-containing protein [Azospirillum largimobile]
MSNVTTKQPEFSTNLKRGLRYRVGDGGWQRVSDYIEVTALAQEEGDQRYLVRLQFADLDGGTRILDLPRHSFTNSRQIIEKLLDAGFQVPIEREQRALLLRYLQTVIPAARLVLLSRSGWYDGAYIMADGTVVGKTASGVVIAHQPAHGSSGGTVVAGIKGDFEVWQKDIAAVALFSHRLLAALCFGLASMLLALTTVETALIHLFGLSSKGKTICQLAALSMFQRAVKTELISWNLTPNALEEIAALHCDRLLVLDEAGLLFGSNPRAGVEAAHDIAFKLVGGNGRRRSRHFATASKTPDWSWRLMGLSSGEKSFTEMAAVAGIARLEGEEVRIIDIPAIMDEETGVFHRVPRGTSSAALALRVEAAAQTHHGHAARAFMEALTQRLHADRERVLKRIALRSDEFMSAAGVSTDSWERRYASRFALAYAAACLAIAAKIVPWQREEALEALVDTYQAARAVPKDGEVQAQAAMVEVWKNVCAQLLARKASTPGDHPPSVGSYYVKMDEDHGRLFLVPPETMEHWVGDKRLRVRLGKWMREQKLLVTTSRGLPTRQVELLGIRGRPTYYCIRAGAVERE